ncbi:MAG TPA: ABC transporter ATP-binding protein [Ktedonobacteraceae bacterium]|nr:ABC transporter ATP-binding protein [Ktedonobacteraceae bacterium]
MSNLEVQGLVKHFGSTLVVDRVSFHVDDGEFFVLLGPSGGGKTTILRMICGLEQPDRGQVCLGGRDVTRLSPRQRNVGMVFQDYGLYPTMNVYGNIAYGLENQHMPKPEIQQRVQAAAEKLGLTPHLQRSISDLSGGEQQRVALARILARDAQAYLYDEPLANLDPKLRHQARRDIMAVHRLRRAPSIYVTHDQSEAFAIADRIAVIAQGRLQQVGTPDQLIETPANLFMAGFIGSPPMNLLSGNVSLDDAQAVLRVKDTSFTLPDKWQAVLNAADTAEITLGIRPQTIVPEWQLAEMDGQLSVTTATVTDVENLIGEIYVYLDLGEGVPIVAVWQETDTVPTVGETLRVGLDPETFCLFDSHSEQALSPEYQASKKA